MARITVQKPSDQPTGKLRLLEELRSNLSAADLTDFSLVVAFAKVGPLLRLEREIQTWRARRKSIKAIFGIDQRGTSREALEFARTHFSETYIAHVRGPFSITFHPKIYLFSGPTRALAYMGSNNLTVGGTETNLESFIKLEFDLPGEAETYSIFLSCWTDCLPISVKLDAQLLSELVERGLVWDEKTIRTRNNSGETSNPMPAFDNPQGLALVPPSPLPGGRRLSTAPGLPTRPELALVRTSTSPAEALVMQIVPHDNGEVFLSKLAVNQNPDFFGFPFQGRTTPKFSKNPPYPQRLPDPVVNITVFDEHGGRVAQHSRFGLNTVYYENKGEIRITVPQDVVVTTPPFSIMVMQVGRAPGIDYEISIFAPGNPEYDRLLAACNQSMPSGGRPVARRFGWL